MKYRVDWFCDGQHNKTHFPTYEDAFAYAKSIAVCTGVKSVFMLEMTARYGVYDVLEQIKQRWLTHTNKFQEVQTMTKLLIRLIGAVIGSAPYVAALWMLLNGYNW